MRAPRIAAIFGVLLALPAPARAEDRPSFVPAPATGEQRLSGDQLRALLADGAYECENHDARTNSCEGISAYSVRDNTLIASTVGVVLADPLVRIIVEGPAHLRGDSVCFVATELDIRVVGTALPQDQLQALVQATKTELGKMQQACQVYVRLGDMYATRAWTANGAELDPGLPSTSRFFGPNDPAPSLRAAGPAKGGAS